MTRRAPHQRYRHHFASRRGFTLVELLVVVAIIAVLMSLLIPALGAAKRNAIKVSCGANLRAMGQAATFYASDNNSFVMLSFIGQSGGSANPQIWGGDDWHQYIGPLYVYGDWQPPFPLGAANGIGKNMINVSRMARYLPGVTNPPVATHSPPWPGNTWDPLSDGYLGEPFIYTFQGNWLCPATGSTNIPTKASFFFPGWPMASWMQYAYFGRIGSWTVPTGATRPQDITDNEFQASRVLFADTTVYNGGGSGQWIFNHGKSGGGDPIWIPGNSNPPTQLTSDTNNIEGRNTCFGDTHVEWQPFDAGKLKTSALIAPTGSDPVNGDTFPCVCTTGYTKIYY